jgi:hypothetical protein
LEAADEVAGVNRIKAATIARLARNFDIGVLQDSTAASIAINALGLQ